MIHSTGEDVDVRFGNAMSFMEDVPDDLTDDRVPL